MTKTELHTKRSELLTKLTPLYMQQADLYRLWNIEQSKPVALELVQQEIAELEAEYDRLSHAE